MKEQFVRQSEVGLTEQNESLGRKYVREQFFQGEVLESHKFLITDRELGINDEEHAQLKEIAALMPDFVNGGFRLFQSSLVNDKLRRKDPLYRNMRNVFQQGKAYESRLQLETARDVEIDRDQEKLILQTSIADRYPFVKIDLVKDREGNFKIVEIEPGKSHGFGYTTLGRNLIRQGEPIGYGVVEHVAQISREKTTALLLSGVAEYYELEADYFAREVRNRGGNLLVIPQREIQMTEYGLFGRNENLHVEQILGIPQFQASNRGSHYDVPALVGGIESLIAKGDITNVTNKDDVLSEKSLLGIISNPQADQLLEELLIRVMDGSALRNMRKFIPPTECLDLSRRHRLAIEAVRHESERYFVKASRSSGSHGLAGPGNQKEQIDMIRPKGNVVIQEKVNPAYQHFNYEDVKTGQKGEGDFAIRYVLFADNSGNILDLALTASPSIIAHGGKKSILVSPVIE
jgi:hypothetical protein